MCADPKNVVYIISGRDSSFLADKLGHIKNLGFSAEHGCFLKLPGSDKWQNLTEGLDMSWRKDVEDIFRYYEVRTTGSQVEKKTAAITFHHRNADPTWGEFQAKECQAILESMQARLMIDVMVVSDFLYVVIALTLTDVSRANGILKSGRHTPTKEKSSSV